ncbi:unnamed protein product [marine sediment metagenome]|uniref:Uncharacterized protein n=1 Tax=marine sediment metagenome TaxID=412755 RepID=X1RMU1_9ZZZZ
MLWSEPSDKGADMPTPPILTGTGTTQVTTTTIRPVRSSWGLGVGKHGGESLAFFIQPQAELSKYGSLNTFGRIKPL